MSSGGSTVRDYLQAAKMSLAEAVGNLPAANRCILGVCVVSYVVSLLFVDLWDLFGLNVDAVVQNWQVYRFFTYSFIQPVLLGLIINTVVLLSIASRLERALGTLPTVWVLVVTFTAVPGMLFVAVAFVLNGIFGTSIGVHSSPVGLGPVIFACFMWISSQDSAGSCSLFGRYTIQAAHYPWLLFALSALLSSFDYTLLNGAGMAIGYLYARGKMERITPSPDLFLRAETETRVGRTLTSTVDQYVGVEQATGLQTTLSGWLPVWTADVSDAQERGAASPDNSAASGGATAGLFSTSPSAPVSGYQTGPSVSNPSSTSGDSSFPGQGHKLGA
ncbi:hypothetical protein DFQ26_006086 [Actinomortierella ambigua]|nr:hypothetical protein DFQ26_006086 [Actinomortierella ambigua]